MRLTVLGSCGPWPTAGRACSGYLVEVDGSRIALDLGYGALPQLMSVLDVQDLGAVVLTHAHPDHCADVHPLYRARLFRPDPLRALDVFCQSGALDALSSLEGETLRSQFFSAFEIHEFEPGDTFKIGPIEVRTCSLPHFVPNAAIRIEASGLVLVYTGDTGPSPAIVEFARGADLLIADATGLSVLPPLLAPFHLSAAQAGHYAAEAGVQRLVLSHFGPLSERNQAVVEAQRSFGGQVFAATEGLTLDLLEPLAR